MRRLTIRLSEDDAVDHVCAGVPTRVPRVLVACEGAAIERRIGVRDVRDKGLRDGEVRLSQKGDDDGERHNSRRAMYHQD